MKAAYTYRGLGSLTTSLRVLLAVGVAMAVVWILLALVQAKLAAGAELTEDEQMVNDLAVGAVAWLYTALFLSTVVVFGVWIVQANQNVRALGAEGLRMTPAWALGWFFVPVAWLWKPYQAMKDLWRASHDPTAWKTVAAPTILAVWWGLWLSTNFLGQWSLRQSLAAEGARALQEVARIDVITGCVDILLCLASMTVVSRIARNQSRHALERAQLQPAAAGPVDLG